MASQESTAEFETEPLLFLDHALKAAGDAFWLPGRKLCLVDPAASKAVLRRGIFGPREAQVRIAWAGRKLLRALISRKEGR